jgi:undecaprenyl-diphosphatase
MSAQLQDDDSALHTQASTALEVARARRTAWRERVAQSRAHWTARDLAWATRMNRAAEQPLALAPLMLASRMGDGGLWYAVMAGLALLGDSEARLCAARMALVGLLCVTLYKWIKAVVARPRPYARCLDIRVCVRALDQFSFPSGHVLHAVAFSLILVHTYPALGWVLWPFVALLALSRVTLGLHYPSDVVAGASIGAALAALIITVL